MKYKIPGSILWTLRMAAGLNVILLSQNVEGDEQPPPLPPDCLSYCEANRPDLSDANPFTLVCSQTKDPNLCQYTCKNNCPMGLACVDDAYDKIKCPEGTRTGEKVSPGISKHELLIFLIGALVSLVVVLCLGTIALKLCRTRRRRRERARRNLAQDDEELNAEESLFSNDGLAPPSSSPKSKKKKKTKTKDPEEEQQACYADASGCLIPVPEEPLSALSLS